MIETNVSCLILSFCREALVLKIKSIIFGSRVSMVTREDKAKDTHVVSRPSHLIDAIDYEQCMLEMGIESVSPTTATKGQLEY